MVADLEARTVLWIESGLAFSFRKSDELNGSPFFDLITPGVPSSYTMYISNRAHSIAYQGHATCHPANLQEILLNHVSSSVHCHLNHRLVSYKKRKNELSSSSKMAKLLYATFNGTNSVVCKVFLANKRGINSSSEEALINASPVWSGTSVYRGLVKSEVIKRELPNHRALTTPMIVRSYFPLSVIELPWKYSARDDLHSTLDIL